MPAPRLTTATLLGTWQLVRCDAPLEIQPGTQMQFAAERELTYVIPTAHGTFRTTLDWHFDNGTLHTRNADGSNAVAVGVTLGEAEILVFDFGGPRAFFVRST